MSSKTEFLCPNCGNADFGAYCSKCSHSTRIPPEQLSVLLAQRLTTRCYYVNLKLSGEHSFPYKELKERLNTLSEQSTELLAFDGVYFNDAYWEWWDPPPIRHGDRTIFAFADGHVE